MPAAPESVSVKIHPAWIPAAARASRWVSRSWPVVLMRA